MPCGFGVGSLIAALEQLVSGMSLTVAHPCHDMLSINQAWTVPSCYSIGYGRLEGSAQRMHAEQTQEYVTLPQKLSSAPSQTHAASLHSLTGYLTWFCVQFR